MTLTSAATLKDSTTTSAVETARRTTPDGDVQTRGGGWSGDSKWTTKISGEEFGTAVTSRSGVAVTHVEGTPWFERKANSAARGPLQVPRITHLPGSADLTSARRCCELRLRAWGTDFFRQPEWPLAPASPLDESRSSRSPRAQTATRPGSGARRWQLAAGFGEATSLASSV